MEYDDTTAYCTYWNDAQLETEQFAESVLESGVIMFVASVLAVALQAYCATRACCARRSTTKLHSKSVGQGQGHGRGIVLIVLWLVCTDGLSKLDVKVMIKRVAPTPGMCVQASDNCTSQPLLTTLWLPPNPLPPPSRSVVGDTLHEKPQAHGGAATCAIIVLVIIVLTHKVPVARGTRGTNQLHCPS